MPWRKNVCWVAVTFYNPPAAMKRKPPLVMCMHATLMSVVATSAAPTCTLPPGQPSRTFRTPPNSGLLYYVVNLLANVGRIINKNTLPNPIHCLYLKRKHKPSLYFRGKPHSSSGTHGLGKNGLDKGPLAPGVNLQLSTRANI